LTDRWKGPVVLSVRSEPVAPLSESEYHAWYANHITQLLAVPGVLLARRFESIDGDMRFMAMYEIANQEVMQSEAYRSVGRFGRIDPYVRYTRNVYREIPLEGQQDSALT
jgi:hypothetical protein